MPLFSLVIPTLQRPDTFRHALATVLKQSFGDFEIIVQNNGRDAVTEAIVREQDDSRIKHFSSSSILTMTENWEAALAAASGEFITFIGDDDGLLPDACQVAREIFARTGLDIVNWYPFCYYWPNYIDRDFCNRLMATVDYEPHIKVMSSQEQLRRLYRFSIDYSQMPMIYNSFVRRKLLEHIKGAVGRYFFGQYPDVGSGIIDAAYSSYFAHVSRALSISGLSGHSTGHNVFLANRDQASSSRIERDFGQTRFHPLLVPLSNLEMAIANDMLVLRDTVLPHGRYIEVDFRQLIERIAANINNRPDYYQETLAAITAMAANHDVRLAEISIPPPLGTREAPKPRVGTAGQNRIELVIDGDMVGLTTIADAVGLMTQIIPKVERTVAIDLVRRDAWVSYRPGDIITFGRHGNGVPLLENGWGEPERWGTWSIASRALLRLSIEHKDTSPVDAVLDYRAFVVPGHDKVTVTCRIHDRDVITWSCRAENPAGSQQITIPGDAISAGTVEMEFLISSPRSPAELGINSDMRSLGLGIESLQLLPDGRKVAAPQHA